MKKRIVSLLLVICLVIGILPSITPQSDASGIIGSVIKAGLTVCKSVIKGSITTAKNVDYYNGNLGKCLLGQFKNIAADLTGMDIGEKYGEDDIVKGVTMEDLESELQTISNALEEQSAAIHQLESTVVSGIQSLSEQMASLSSQIADQTKELKYSTYLNSFFEFFNQYYEAISYYDGETAYAISEKSSAAYTKNIFDQFYHLENVEYSGNLHSAVEKLGKYLRGEYLSTDPGSVVDILSQYYILAYKGAGKSEAEAERLAAESTEEMISYIYYAYCMGVYFEEMVALYQTAYMAEAATDEYLTDFGTYISESQMTNKLLALLQDAQDTAGCVLGALLDNYTHSSIDMPYCSRYESADGGDEYWYSRSVNLDETIRVRTGSTFYLPDPADLLSDDFSSELRSAFSECTSYRSDVLEIQENRVDVPNASAIDGGSWLTHYQTLEYGETTAKIDICVGTRTVSTIDMTVWYQNLAYVLQSQGMWDGDGTATFPYLLTDIQMLKSAPLTTRAGTYTVLACDLDGNGTEIDGYGKFDGTFDGNGHTIRNVVVTGSNDYASGSFVMGLFNTVTGTVRDLTLDNVTVSTSNSATKNTYVGVLAGLVDGGTIIRCRVKNSSARNLKEGLGNDRTNQFHVNAGGIAGGVSGSNACIDSCSVERTHVYAYTSSQVSPANSGGITGFVDNGGTVKRCQVFLEPTGGKQDASANYNEDTFDILALAPYTSVSGRTDTSTAGGFVGRLMDGKLETSWIISNSAEWPVAAFGYAINKSSTTMIGTLVGYLADEASAVSGSFLAYAYEGISDNAFRDAWCGNVGNTTLTNASLVTELTSDSVYSTVRRLGNNADSYYRNWVRGEDAEMQDDEIYYIPLRELSRSGGGDVLLAPLKTEYISGEYLNLAGMVPQLIIGNENIGRASAYALTEETKALLNAPLAVGTYKIGVVYGNGVTQTVTITVKDAHIYFEQVIPATCTEAGSSQLICAECGATKEPVTIPALGHDIVNHACTRCNYTEDCPSAEFSDLDTSRWYHAGIDFVLKNGYMAGTDKGFQPDAALTREMLAQILYAKAGKPAVTITGRFPDEDTSRWYAAAIEWAAENGYIAGYGNGNFGVGDAVTREQIAVILYAYEGKPDVGETTLDSYPDAGQVSGWAKTAMVWAVENGLITGNAKGELMPKDAATRATFAVIFYAYLEK